MTARQKEYLEKQATKLKFQFDKSDLIQAKYKAKCELLSLDRKYKAEKKRLNAIVRQCSLTAANSPERWRRNMGWGYEIGVQNT